MTIKIAFVDACLPDYFGGHHLPVLQVPVDGTTTRQQIADMLHSELNEGVIDYELDKSNISHDDVHRAIDECVFFDEMQKPDDIVFPELDIFKEDCDCSVYTFFVVMKD